jgi:hypothetical protein
MKKLVFLVALALLALVAPASAADETSTAAPVTFEQLTGAPVTPVDQLIIIQPIQYCSVVNGTVCPARSRPRGCTDVCRNQLSCDCVYVNQTYGWRWRCDQEC